MLLVILNWGLSYMFVHQSVPRLDDVNGNSRVQAYSKHPLALVLRVIISQCARISNGLFDACNGSPLSSLLSMFAIYIQQAELYCSP